MNQALAALLEENGISFEENLPMAAYTTFRIGGPADLAVFPADERQLAFCQGLFAGEAIVLGNGSNVLVSDRGIAGAVILLGKQFSAISREGNCLTAQAGAKLSALSAAAVDAGLSGLEFAAGIPGTVGGGVYMNAGAYGGELGQFLESARVMDLAGRIYTLSAAQLDLRYRHSLLMEQPLTLLSARFVLPTGDPDASRERIRTLQAARRKKQPLDFPSAGSTFKRPEGGYAAALIEQCGLKGCAVGGAQVSPKHAGFVVNTGGATADDVRALIRHVQQCVEAQTGIRLEPEVRFLGRP